MADRRVHHANAKFSCRLCTSSRLEQGAHCRPEVTPQTQIYWAIRIKLEPTGKHRDLALFNLTINSELRGCDLMRRCVINIMAFGQIKQQAVVLQIKT